MAKNITTDPHSATLTCKELFIAFFNAPTHDRSASVLAHNARNQREPYDTPSTRFGYAEMLDNDLPVMLTDEIRNLIETADDPAEVVENLVMELQALATDLKAISDDFEKVRRECAVTAPNDDEDSDEWKRWDARGDLYEVDSAVLATVFDGMFFKDDDYLDPTWQAIKSHVEKYRADLRLNAALTSRSAKQAAKKRAAADQPTAAVPNAEIEALLAALRAGPVNKATQADDEFDKIDEDAILAQLAAEFR